MPGLSDLLWQLAANRGIRFTADSTTNPQPWINAPTGWDAQYRAAAARCVASSAGPALRPLRVSIIGASDEVYFATDSLTTSWPGLFRQRLISRYGLMGDFYHIRMNIVDSPNWGGTPPIVANAAGGRVPTAGAYGGTSTYTVLNTTLWTFTSQYNCGQIDVNYLDSATAFTYSVDGGAFITTGVVATGTNAQKRLKILPTTVGWNPALTTHTVAIQQTVAGTAVICGFCAYVTTDAQLTGVFFARLTYPGGSTFDWFRQDTVPVDKITQLAGNTNNAAPVTGSYGPPMNPDLIIFASDLAGNDMIQGTTLENSEDGFYNMMNASRRAVDNCSLASVIVNIPNGKYSDVLLVNCPPNAALWPMYKTPWLVNCAKFGAAIFDLDAKWGNLGVQKGFQANVAGGFHMTQAGNNDADQLLQLGGL